MVKNLKRRKMNIVICGFGRAGKAMAEKVLYSDKHNLLMVLCRKESQNAGKDIGEILIENNKVDFGVKIIPIDEAAETLKDQKVDVVIDFSKREMALPLIDFCGKIGANLVLCTTNHTVEEISLFRELSSSLGVGIVYAPNLTVGVNLLMEFVKKVANVLADFDFEIIEKHPKDKAKVTATARMISQSINRGDIPIHAVRMNGYVGVHQVIATNGDERITVTHESLARRAFANGAILAADFIQGKKHFYLMKDVIKEIEEKALKEQE